MRAVHVPVTVEQDDGNWLVNEIELSSLGNQ